MTTTTITDLERETLEYLYERWQRLVCFSKSAQRMNNCARRCSQWPKGYTRGIAVNGGKMRWAITKEGCTALGKPVPDGFDDRDLLNS